jgi:hypothetical protein
MSGPETTDSPQLKLAKSLIEAFSKRNVDDLAKILHKDHRRIYYPRSLGKPDLTRENWLKYTADVVGLWTDCRVSNTRFTARRTTGQFALTADRPFYHRNSGKSGRSRSCSNQPDRRRVVLR